MKHALLFAVFAIAMPGIAGADSPLTSTTFYKAYLEDEAGREDLVELLKGAAATKALNDEMLEYLTKRRVRPQAKLALVNALGWSLDGSDDPNSARFLKHVTKGKPGELKALSAEQLTLYGYMLALENYQGGEGLGAAFRALQLAKEKHRESYIANLALTLVDCQILFDADDWKGVWKRYLELEADEELQDKLSADSVKIVRDYLKLYE